MENSIIVTINYRLHVLGFLSLPSMGISGNAGLKDQQMAIEWVYDNISHFNGDPKKICLFGESAGGASVHLQILNPKSRRFITSAICQSGCALGDWVVQKNAVSVTKKLAKILGAESDSDEDALKVLMSASVEDLFRLKTKPQDPDDRRRNLVFTFKPSIELESSDAFMTRSPVDLIKLQAGQINLPLIFGTTDKDGCVMVASYLHMTESFNKDSVRLVPQSLSINPNSIAAKLLGEEIKRFYFRDKDIDQSTISNFVDHMTDFHFLTPQIISVELHNRYNPKSRTFLYEFRFNGELNLYKKLLQMENITGKCSRGICGIFFFDFFIYRSVEF
jgi:carboxylesterase type B